MPNTYTQLYVQIVFAVKGRKNLIHESWEEELYKYIIGIIKQKGQMPLAVNGMPDHIHIFVSLSANCSLSELVREIKKSSNKYINDKKLNTAKFQWQNGFGAFSYSHSAISNVTRYVEKQKEHHQNKSFKKEFIEFLDIFQIENNPEHHFEWYDTEESAMPNEMTSV